MKKFSKKDLIAFRNERIIELYNSGDTITGIAEEINDTIENVKAVLKANGILKATAHGYVKSDKAVLKLFNEGENFKEICFELSLPTSLVWGILKKYGLSKQYKYSGKTFATLAELEIGRKKIAKEIAALYKKGHSKEYLKKEFRLSMKSINAIIRHHGKSGGGTRGFIAGGSILGEGSRN